MHLTKTEIFQKSWLFSVICGTLVASLFWFVSSLGNWFDLTLGRVVSFFDVLMILGVTGSYFGAGYVGWRIVDKYLPSKEKRFIRGYIRYSLISFLLLLGVVYSPLTFLALLWSFIPPYCVLRALDSIKKSPKKK